MAEEDHPRDTKPGPLNIVLLGRAGSGKSASGNTILGNLFFESHVSPVPVTKKCEVTEYNNEGTFMRVIDTPDFFDEKENENEHLKNCIAMCNNEPCVYLLVIQASRFTDGEREILDKLEKAFKRKISDKTIVLFTHGDDLEYEGVCKDDFVKAADSDLQKIIERCGKRYHFFQNQRQQTKDSRQQTKDLLDKIRKVPQSRS